MRRIVKLPPPTSFVGAAQQGRARIAKGEDARSVFDEVPKATIRLGLRKEQGGLCAFCTSRLSDHDHQTRIAHVVPLSADRTRTLDWKNLVLSCDAAATCDRRQGDRTLHLNPAASAPDVDVVVQYAVTGRLRFVGPGHESHSAEQLQRELDEVLGLNIGTLIDARTEVIASARRRLERSSPGAWSIAAIDKEIAWWKSASGDRPQPWFRAAVGWLEAQRRRHGG